MRVSARLPAVDRVSLSLCGVFLLAAVFYVWTAGTTYTLLLHGASTDPYNQLANAFLHLRLWVSHAPAGLLQLPEPYNPAQNVVFKGFNGGIGDFVLYNKNLYLTWGPAPVIVLLVPLHLLGFEPSASVTVSIFSIAGLGFALATLRVILRQIGDVPLWMCILAGLTLALCSAVPFMLRRPAVYEEAISGGYCFAMAGIWLAITALAERRASLPRLVLMSLCFGLAIGSRPTLVFPAVLLVFVYLALRNALPRRHVLMALLIPVGVCGVLLMAYNQARFGSPLENGVNYQLAGIDPKTVRYGDLSYVLPGVWFYAMSLPRVTSLFPFLILSPLSISYPGGLSKLYATSTEATGGLLPMAPILAFIAVLPWMWRRRATTLRHLSLPLIALAGAGTACLLFVSYTFFATTERYEVDFATLFLLGGLAGWLALAHDTRGRRRRTIRIGGGLLATWGCIAGVAISFTGYYNLLATTHPGTWRTLVDAAAPVSRVIALFKGHPEVGEVNAAQLPLLNVGEQAEVVIVSPDARNATLVAAWLPAIRVGDTLEHSRYTSPVLVRGPGRASTIERVPPHGEFTRIRVRLDPGVNRVELVPLAAEASGHAPAVPVSQQLMYVDHVSLATE